MRVCIYGAGAGGGHFGARLAQAGHEVSLIARGPHLAAIKSGGLTLISGDEEIVTFPAATDDSSEPGHQDLVIVTVKATALASVAEGLKPLVGPETRVLFTQNGMPWWYPLGIDIEQRLPALPSFALSDAYLEAVRPEQILGGLIYSANEVREPGVVFNNSPGANRMDIGAIVPEHDGDAEPFREALRAAQIGSLPVNDIREAIWKKLLFNMSGSVIALATGNQSSIARRDPALGEVYLDLVNEGLAIAAAYGYRLNDELRPEEMLKKTLDHKPSLLQDFEQGRAMEIAEIVLAPLEFARAAGLNTPALRTIAAIVVRRAKDKGLFA